LRDASLVLLNVPFSLVGGVIALQACRVALILAFP
jgi:Cu/Ag efflux pump CusA